MASDNTAVLIIGMVLIVAMVMYGPVSMGFSNFLDTLWDSWGDLFGDLNGQGQFGSTGLGVTIHYTDGTTDEYHPSEQTLFPLSITIDGKEIQSITWSVWLKVDWTGTLDRLDATGNIEVLTQTGPFLISSTGISYSGVPSKNEWQLIDSLTVTHAQIESVIIPEIFFWVLEGYATSTMTFSFADGETVTKTPEMGPTQVFITYETAGLTVFKIDLRSTNL